MQKRTPKVGIVYNACYGGFGFSQEALALGRKLSKDPNWGEDFRFGEGARHDPVLVKVVKRLGVNASGPFAKLVIRNVPVGTRYRIEEYDGRESVILQDEEEWIEAK